MQNYRALSWSELAFNVGTRLKSSQVRRLIYPLLVVAIYIIWSSFMTVSNSWHLFQEFWPMSVTMAAGSFVAGATPLGGAAVAFPVFTKVLNIPATDARTFGLMIQTMGMTMAAVVILARRITILPHVVGWSSVGAMAGMFLGAFYLPIPGPYPKVLFTFVITAFGVAMALSRWKLETKPQLDITGWNHRHGIFFILIGLLGGIFSASTGNGADMFAFILMTLAFGLHEKISTPTTVVIMAITSIVGFFIHGVIIQDIGLVWDYWLVAVPVVIVGAPLGAYVVSVMNRDHLIAFVLCLISFELITTIWLVKFDAAMLVVTSIATAVCVIWFWVMLRYRRKSTREPILSDGGLSEVK